MIREGAKPGDDQECNMKYLFNKCNECFTSEQVSDALPAPEGPAGTVEFREPASPPPLPHLRSAGASVAACPRTPRKIPWHKNLRSWRETEAFQRSAPQIVVQPNALCSIGAVVFFNAIHRGLFYSGGAPASGERNVFFATANPAWKSDPHIQVRSVQTLNGVIGTGKTTGYFKLQE